MDQRDNRSRVKGALDKGATYIQDQITQENLDSQLKKYLSAGDFLLDLAWNIDANTILNWCHDNGVLYLNTSVEQWDPYEGGANKHPLERTLYHRHMSMREMKSKWNKVGATAIVEHGANPGLVSHLVKKSMVDIATLALKESKAAAGVESALTDERYNDLAHLLGVSRKQIHSQAIELNEIEQEKIATEFNELIKQRLMGRPVQYITGNAAFRYLELEVGEGVLIPRPETELIVDRVIGYLNSQSDKDQAKSIIDLGAGSGAISIAIASEASIKGLKVSMVAVEKSPDAAQWLNKNIAKYDLPIRVVVEDVQSALPEVKADVVVANPPYIPNDEKLPIEVANFEPEIALRGGPVDGMLVPKQFIEAATRLLKSGGYFITEHHEKQAELIRNLLTKDFLPAQTHADLTGRDRFTSAVKR